MDSTINENKSDELTKANNEKTVHVKGGNQTTISAKRLIIIAIIIFAVGVFVYAYQGLDSTKYKKGDKALQSGDYEKAIEIFDSVSNYSDSKERIKEAEYKYGKVFFNSGDYEKAKEHFTLSMGYNDAAEMINECDYETAKYYMEAGNYSTALEYISGIENYKDSSDLNKECLYQIACMNLDGVDAMSARTSFLELGEYKDSPQKAKEATEKCKEELYNEGVQEYTAGYFQSAYEYLKDISDYKDAASYLDKTNIMLSFSGVYRNELKKKENADYLVIKGWDLYQRGMHRSDIFEQYKVSLVEVNDETGYEYALVGEKYRDTPSLAPTIYYLVDEYDGKWIKDAVGLKAINPFYRGYGSYLEYIEDDEVTFDQLEAIYNKELNRKAPSVGMTEEQVRESTWGEPEKINRTTTASGVEEQWCYTSPRRYVYLRDGVVTAIQE